MRFSGKRQYSEAPQVRPGGKGTCFSFNLPSVLHADGKKRVEHVLCNVYRVTIVSSLKGISCHDNERLFPQFLLYVCKALPDSAAKLSVLFARVTRIADQTE